MLWLFMRFNGWVAVVPLLLGAGIVYVGTVISEDAARLDAEGVDAMATVIGKREYERRSGTNSTTTTYYNVRYHFPVGGGALHYGDRDVSRSFFETLAYGSEIPVRFLPADAEVHEIEGGAVGDNAIYATLVGACFLLLGVAALWLFVRQTLRAAAVRDHGERAEAIVETIDRQSGANTMRFRFTDRNGTEHQGKSIAGRRWRVANIEPGTTIPIRYDPNAPKRAFREADLSP